MQERNVDSELQEQQYLKRRLRVSEEFESCSDSCSDKSSMAGSSRPMTPASPRILNIKTREAGVPLFGCEHLRKLMTTSQESTSNAIHHYKKVLRVVLDKARTSPQTSASPAGAYITSLLPNYLCLQCPAIITLKDRPRHANDKAHQFFVESRNGALFCQICSDYIWDPTLEDLRMRKVGAGRKRKHSEMFLDNPDYTAIKTPEAPCRSTGLRGIYNMGSTCFMSVILQAFVHNPLLRNFYLSDGHDSASCAQDECLSCGMGELFQEFYGQDTTASYIAADILATSWSSQQAKFQSLSGDDEKDAHEYFQFLTEVLHETAVNRLIDSSDSQDDPLHERQEGCSCIVHQTFYGQIQQSMTCHHCRDVRNSFQPFLDLNLGLEGPANLKNRNRVNGAQITPQTLTLQGCLNEEYTHEEQIEQYTCHECGHGQQGAKLQRSIKRLPNVLSIQFKRFEHHKKAKTSTKIDTKVQFPLQINMLPYTSRARVQDMRENFELARSCTYDLLSVVVHQGDLSSGHYTSYSRVGNQWFLFDDHKVTVASESQVLGAEAFILFYIVRSLA